MGPTAWSAELEGYLGLHAIRGSPIHPQKADPAVTASYWCPGGNRFSYLPSIPRMAPLFSCYSLMAVSYGTTGSLLTTSHKTAGSLPASALSGGVYKLMRIRMFLCDPVFLNMDLVLLGL